MHDHDTKFQVSRWKSPSEMDRQNQNNSKNSPQAFPEEELANLWFLRILDYAVYQHLYRVVQKKWNGVFQIPSHLHNTTHMARWGISLEDKWAKDQPIRLSGSHSMPNSIQQNKGSIWSAFSRCNDNQFISVASHWSSAHLWPWLCLRKSGIEWEPLNWIGWSLAHFSSRKIPYQTIWSV